MPDSDALIWDWFWEQRQSQPTGFSGAVSVSNVEHIAWCRFSGNILTWDEVGMLRHLDARFCLETVKKCEAIRVCEAKR